ncbi:lysophospholipid acyltransferase family protein [Thermodesulfobacteriota bacterium]
MKIRLSPLLQSKLNIFIYKNFGWGLAKFYISFLGRLYYFFNHGEKQTIKKAVFDVFGRVDQKHNLEDITQKIFQGIFSHYYEKLYIAFEDQKKAAGFLNQSVSRSDLSILRRSQLKGKGVIVITGHYGAIEYIPTLFAVNDFDVSMIAKFKTKLLKRQVFAQAIKYGIRLIDAEHAGSSLRTAIHELKQNRVLVTQCDEIEAWKLSKRDKTSFLGKVTGLDRTINIIQRRTGAEIVFGIIHRYNLNEYKLIMYSYEDMLKMLDKVSTSSIGETVLKVLEQFIYHYPEQWYQWKKYPDIKNSSSSGAKAGKSASLPFLQPAFGKIL